MYKRPIRLIQIDLVSTCNAKCLHCYRQTVLGAENPSYEKNVHINPQSFKQALLDPYLNELEEILFCGNYGDPMASIHLMEILDYIDEIKPNLKLMFHTNGSLGSKELWKKLGTRLNGRGRFIKFAIDGLEDTNHIYRRGVVWTTLMENVEAFIQAGGRAAWMFIIFDHNAHQVEEARALAFKLGFAKFETRKNFASHYNPNYSILTEEQKREYLAKIPKKTLADYIISQEQLDKSTIDCEARTEENIYIDHEGRVWPCCFIAGWKQADDHAKRVYHIEKMEKRFKPFFNSLDHYNMSEIMNHSLFKSEIEDSWTKVDKIHYMCHYKCGKEKCTQSAGMV